MEESSNKNKIREFTDLYAWQKGHTLVILVYTITKSLPDSEKFGLISQMQRAAVSITSNIAEGFGRRGIKEKIQFYYIAHGSLTEVKNISIILRDTHLIDIEIYKTLFEALSQAQATLLGLLRATKNI